MIIRRFAVLILISLSLALSGGAQTPKAFENAADKAMNARDYYSALKYFEKILEMLPERTDIQNQHADAARLFGAYNLAESSYLKVVAADKEGKHPSAIYWLAVIEKTLGKYDAAIKHFEQFTATKNPDPQLATSAVLELEECEWAMEQINNPDASIIIERLPEEPNTVNSEFAATQRGDTMFYSSFRDIEWGDKHYPERPIIKVMESIEGRAPAISSLNDGKRHTAHTAFDEDGDLMVFNKCDYVGETDIRCELYFNRKSASGWGIPVKLPEIINIPGYTVTQPNIAFDEEGYFVLYFVSDCPGGQGGLDIWKSKFTWEGNFSKPENLVGINTSENDITPFFDNKTKILYFSTLGLKTIGGYDIYKSPLNNGAWSEPEHLDLPFNSSYDDIYFAMQGDDWAYFSSNRLGSAYLTDEACCYDIYKGTYLALKLQTLAFSKLSNEPLDGVIFTLLEVPQDNPVVSRYSNEKNEAEFDVKRDKKYMVIASKEGYLPDTIELSTNTLPPTRKFVEKLYLEPTDFALNVRTFNQFYKSPLSGVTIRLLELPGNVKEEKNTKETNETNLLVRAETQYSIVATKPGFFPDTVIVGAGELKPGARVTKNLFLTPNSLNSFLPIALYFDNDQPDPRTRKETTLLSYDQTYDKYMVRREEFYREFTRGMSGAEKREAEIKLDSFFESDVKNGYLKLDYFANNMNLFLENNYKVEIMVKGFASPLANSAYNMALTKRRIASVLNYFRKVQGGVFQRYLISGQLSVVTMPFGETAASPQVSDNPGDKRRSIFSVEASRERRAEILEIRLTRHFKS